MGRLKKVGVVSNEEAKTIYTLFMRKKALDELTLISSSFSNDLKRKLETDILETSQKFDMWWQEIEHKYSLESQPDCQWEIDFETHEIYLISDL